MWRFFRVGVAPKQHPASRSSERCADILLGARIVRLCLSGGLPLAADPGFAHDQVIVEEDQISEIA